MLQIGPSALSRTKFEVLGYIPLPENAAPGQTRPSANPAPIDLAVIPQGELLKRLTDHYPAAQQLLGRPGLARQYQWPQYAALRPFPASPQPLPTPLQPAAAKAPDAKPENLSLDALIARGKDVVVGGILIEGSLKGAYWANTVQPDQAIAVFQQSTNMAPGIASFVVKSAMGLLSGNVGHAVTFGLLVAGSGYIVVKVVHPKSVPTIATGLMLILGLFLLGVLAFVVLKYFGIFV